MEKFYTVEDAINYCHSGNFASLEEATNEARAKAWRTGFSCFVMAPVALAHAPELVNTVKVDTL